MDVTIIGTGNMGKALAARPLAGGHNVTLLGTAPEKALDVFLASDDEGAKGVVSELVRDGGLRPVDAGPLARAHELEALGFLHMVLQEPLGTGFASTIKVLS